MSVMSQPKLVRPSGTKASTAEPAYVVEEVTFAVGKGVWPACVTIRSACIGGLFLLGAIACETGSALAKTQSVHAVMRCTALSTNPAKNPAFTAEFNFDMANGSLTAERFMRTVPGKEVYHGEMNGDGVVEIVGRGAYFNTNVAWTTSFSGALSKRRRTDLAGEMRPLSGTWTRKCSLSLLEKPKKLAAGLMRPTQTTAKAVPADKKTQHADAGSRKDRGLPDDQSQKPKEVAPSAASPPGGSDNASVDDAKWIQKVLGGIVLPATEDPRAWMMRVAAVPVQQQQFCRIVDQFHDDLQQIYRAHNDIKRNALFRERKVDMATLLPKGEFQNWVVQVKEVAQAPDGSAAVMLQPPCRALLGSDACQKAGSAIRATIAPQSPLYRSLSQVSAGSFVVVSGKIPYAETANADEPLPSYAVYQAGSHCSSTEESQQEDVFVTDISYLVPMR